MAVKFEIRPEELTWGIVEVMGHSSYGGILREVEFCGAKFLEVTVPEQENLNVGFTMRISPAAIFRMCETTEEWARKHCSSTPDQYRIRVERPSLRPSDKLTWSNSSELDDLDDDEQTSFCGRCTQPAGPGELAEFGGVCEECHAESRGVQN